MRSRVKSKVVEETVATITRTSPRRRKRALDEEVDGPKAPLLASKRPKKRTDATETLEQAVALGAELQGAQGGVKTKS
jgi:hypothetical protein